MKSTEVKLKQFVHRRDYPISVRFGDFGPGFGQISPPILWDKFLEDKRYLR